MKNGWYIIADGETVIGNAFFKDGEISKLSLEKKESNEEQEKLIEKCRLFMLRKHKLKIFLAEDKSDDTKMWYSVTTMLSSKAKRVKIRKKKEEKNGS